jgi:hypothetical protein
MATLVALALISPALACGHYEVRKVVTYRTVVCEEVRTVPCVEYVTKYDHCGNPYTVKVTVYKKKVVQVKKQVPVVKYVQVYCE